MFCCDLFESLVDNAGRRGFSIIAGAQLDLRAFFLQSRTHNDPIIDPSNDRSQSLPLNHSLIFQNAIKFCPFCGTDLKRWIGSNERAFAKLVSEHKELLID